MLFSSQEDALAYIERHVPEKDRAATMQHVQEHGRFVLDADEFNQKGAATLAKYRQELASGKVSAPTNTLLNSLFSSYTDLAEYSVFVPGNLAGLLAYYRTAGRTVFEVAPSEKVAQRATGKLFGSLFNTEGSEPLSLSKEDAPAFFEFVRDILVASTTGKLGPALSTEKVFPEEASDIWEMLSQELHTHNAKNSHASAQYKGVFSGRSCGMGFLNSTELPPLLSGALGGGNLRDRSWLVQVLPFSVQIEGGEPFKVMDCLFSQRIRDLLPSWGVSAFEDLPLFEMRRTEFSPVRLPVVSLKVSDDESVALNIMPANSMIKAMARLANLHNGNRKAQSEKNCEAAALKNQAVFKEKGIEVSESLFFDFFMATSADKSKRRTALLKAVNTRLGKMGRPAISVAQLNKWLTYPERVRGVQKVGVVASNPQNISAAYQAYAGSQGIPRFPAYPLARRNRSALVRRFYTLGGQFKKMLKGQAEQLAVPLTDKYKIGTRWLPQRVQKTISTRHVQNLAAAYVSRVRRLAVPFQKMTEEERLECRQPKSKHSAIQAFALEGSECGQIHLDTLAQEGLVLLKSATAEDHARFKELVIEKLTAKKDEQK